MIVQEDLQEYIEPFIETENYRKKVIKGEKIYRLMLNGTTTALIAESFGISSAQVNEYANLYNKSKAVSRGSAQLFKIKKIEEAAINEKDLDSYKRLMTALKIETNNLLNDNY